jgi:hypothetical protein
MRITTDRFMLGLVIVAVVVRVVLVTGHLGH